MTHFKNIPALADARLAPAQSRLGNSPVIGVYNRIGGLLHRLELLTGLETSAALAVWSVESAGAEFRCGKPLLRFENHVFFARWGAGNQPRFDAHFEFGGRNATAGKPWEQHRFRSTCESEWRRFHGDQPLEYEAFRLASRLAGREPACLCASFGGPQIMGFNHALAGYDSASAMFDRFARSERWHVLGFFDFCRCKDLIGTIRQRHWHDFATVYNGPGNADAYAERINAACSEASALLRSA